MRRDPEPTPPPKPAQPDAACASPPCLAEEADPAYMGYLPRDEVLALLNELLEGERAGVKVASEMRRGAADPAVRQVLGGLGRDEARFCAMLTRHIARLEGAPSAATGAFENKVLSLPGFTERIALLNRGQGWVARKLREALPRIADAALHADLREMLETHRRNIDACNRL